MAVILSKKNVIPERIYRWKKYNTTTKSVYTYTELDGSDETTTSGSGPALDTNKVDTDISVSIYYGISFKFDADTGYFELINPVYDYDHADVPYRTDAGSYGNVSITIPAYSFYMMGSSKDTYVYYTRTSTVYSRTLILWSDGSTDYTLTVPNSDYMYSRSSNKVSSVVKGSNYIETVESIDPSAYPINGVSGNYWYERM